jgi:predicted TIM-barrel fold metal-dependent hydrolase
MNTTSPIACLESYINPSVPIGTSLHIDATSPALHLLPNSTLSKLKNVGSARVKDMRSLGQSKQVLSHIPISANAPTCTRFNDALFSGIHLNADKFVALAILPADGKEAARELQRCVTKMNFVGGVVGLKPDGKGGISLGTELEALWSVADMYRVPIMLRDMWPVGDQVCSLVLQF